MKAHVHRADSMKAGAIMQAILKRLNVVREVGRKAGPYLLLELVLPGGTLCALLLFLWQRRHPQAGMRAWRVVTERVRALASACEPSLWAPMPARVPVRLSKPSSGERR
jgi:hypothetical protein